MTLLQPGSAMGILGGGQLGRMTALAARRMGYRVVVIDPAPGCPAGQVADQQIVAPHDDPTAIAQFARRVDVVTLEFENLPAAMLRILEKHVPTRPRATILEVCQNRLAERRFLQSLDIPVARFAPVLDADSLASAGTAVTMPALLKTATLGYDSKGQRAVGSTAELPSAYKALGVVPCILEQRIPFEREISVIVARDVFGHVAAYDPAENIHVDGILDTSMAPASITPQLAAAARDLAVRIALALDLVGVLAVELFVAPGEQLLVNELAPRPHNSGHWSIEACVTGQFEQHVRTVVGAPVGPTDLLRPVACANLLGDLWQDDEPRWDRLLAVPEVKLHLYGKRDARPGRKMGHLTAFGDTAETARAQVEAARALL